MSLRNLGLAVGVIAITSTTAFGQKKNETTASMERNAAITSMQKADMEGAKNKLLSAKKYIDLAAAHEDTKDNQKTLWLKGEIYSTMLSLGMQTQDMDLIQAVGETGMEDAISSLKRAYPKGKKFKSDVIGTVDRNRIAMNTMARTLYDAKQFGPAAEAYLGQAEFADCIDLIDSSAIYNAAICYDKVEEYEKAAVQYERAAKIGYNGTTCYVLASIAYRNAGMADKATALIGEARKEYPTDRGLLLETVNTHLAAGNNAEAEKALADAIAADPDNKQLHYTIGTIMIELKKNEEAETALNRALELDPDYVDAQYQLGAHLVTWATAIKKEATMLGPNETAKFNKLDKQSDDTYRRALVPLEKYIAAYPKDKSVLTILFQIHRNLGDSAKAMEYKKRADAAE
ncbi:MAG: tetratricopeptide repeat protein [Crocinitomicaceae bacterium]|nr:tetratricopeptide repeat protein [Crocinitomicaceae bacterium]